MILKIIIYHGFVVIISSIILPVFCEIVATEVCISKSRCKVKKKDDSGTLKVWSVGIQFIPERAKVAYMNEKYFYNYTFNIRRYSRQSGYKINLESTTKQPWENNVTINFVIFEYLHNEYRRSFVELHYKFCDLLKYEKFIAPVIISYGTKCPYPVGTHRLMNMTVPMNAFPNVFPFEKSRTDIIFTTANETMLELQLYGSFKNQIPKE